VDTYDPKTRRWNFDNGDTTTLTDWKWIGTIGVLGVLAALACLAGLIAIFG
jgi:hypothetical protein